ncbi:cAMP-specific 3',5'-cyclic phosphodiesterase 4A [Irineochytrium annulatum]|nr:cAMP-specific 3',5'-cyclic phosphodiesterase 4A [Irineochytrium annulatum]
MSTGLNQTQGTTTRRRSSILGLGVVNAGNGSSKESSSNPLTGGNGSNDCVNHHHHHCHGHSSDDCSSNCSSPRASRASIVGERLNGSSLLNAVVALGSRRSSIQSSSVVDPVLFAAVTGSRRASVSKGPSEVYNATHLKSFPSVNNPTPPHHSLGGLFQAPLLNMSRASSQKKDRNEGLGGAFQEKMPGGGQGPRTASNSVMSGTSLNQSNPPAQGPQQEGEDILDLHDINTMKSRMHVLSLTFLDESVENEYEKFFLSKNLAKWRRNLCIIFLSSTALYLYVMIKSPAEAKYWEANFANGIKINTTRTLIAEDVIHTNVTGFDTAMEWIQRDAFLTWDTKSAICDPDYLCNPYNFMYDLLFWFTGVLLPSIAVLLTSYRLPVVQIGRQIHLLSSLFTLALTVVAIYGRFIVIEPNTPMFETCFLSIIAVTACFVFLRLRFFHATLTCAAILVAYVLAYLDRVVISAPSEDYAGLTVKSMTLCLLALAVIGGIICSSCFDAEIFYRSQFLISHNLQKHNMKLIYQLQRLQKVYGNKAADFDSPLEKSVMIIRSMMADPSLTAQHLLELSQVLTLLGSSNLLAPDLENQVTEFMDTEQEAWLFSEIAPRRKNQQHRGRQSMNLVRRRLSLVPDKNLKISEESPPPLPTSAAPAHSEMRQIRQPPSESIAIPDFSTQLRAESTRNLIANDASLSTPLAATESAGLLPLTASHGSGASLGPTVQQQQQQQTSALRKATLQRRQGEKSSNGGHGGHGAIAPVTYNELADLPRVGDLLARHQEYAWPVFEFADACQGRSLSVLATFLFRREGLFSHFQVPVDKFWRFITTIEQGYHADIPFHNATHATDVLHCMAHLAHTEHVARITTDVDILALYLAAIIHDYDHPGYNSNFLVNTYDVRTILYNDRSVLENHHLASAFTVLRKDECNFLAQMPRPEFRALRETVIEMVLATDLSQHFVIISAFKNKVAQAFDPEESREDRVLLWKVLMKCADVSNPTKEWPLYERWCRLVIEEFTRQGDMEKRLSIPVSPYMDRDSLNVPSSQIGFIDYVILPLFEAYDKYAPISHVMEHLKRNRDHWSYLKSLGVVHMANVIPPTLQSAASYYMTGNGGNTTNSSSAHTRESSSHVVIVKD